MQSKTITKRLTGTVISVGSLRGKGSMGVGEFPDLADFAQLCKKMGLGLIQLLPVNDSGYESSPYFSLTAFALNTLYLRIEDLDEYKNTADKAVQAAVNEKIAQAGKDFGKETRFPYYRILKAKMEILRDLYAAHKAAIAKKSLPSGTLAAWIAENSWVKEYAVYRRLKEDNGEKSWKEWKEYREVRAADITALWNNEKLREKHLFWVWIQQALDAQFQKAAKAVADAGLVLEGDLPILMNEDCCDSWAHPEIFIQELSAGCPPDMYCPDGQNWGFPLYNWESQTKNNYAWWRSRLAVAGKYYQAYRIDHVLGFFRIWAASRSDYSAIDGRFVPYIPITAKDLESLGFDKGRVRWVSRSHIPTGEVWDALRNNWGGPFSEDDIAAEAGKIFSGALERIGNEELWLFNKKIRGEKDIDALGLHPAGRAYLFGALHNRIFMEYEKGKFVPAWFYDRSRAYTSLSPEEKENLETLLKDRKTKSEKIWAAQGEKLLSVLLESSDMLPCAEDLGTVPACVPEVLTKLKIPGLRVTRWLLSEDTGSKSAFTPFGKYPELSVCTPSVHDSSTLREWWEREADQEMFAGFVGYPSLPRGYNPGTAKVILSKIASAKSRFRVFQIQDLLHLSPKYYAEDPASERINVPGTYNDFNWTYRLPVSIEELAKDRDLLDSVAELAKVQPETDKKNA